MAMNPSCATRTVEPLDELDCVADAEEEAGAEAELLPLADKLADALAAADEPPGTDRVTPTVPDPTGRVVTMCVPLADRLSLASLTALQ